MSEESLVDAIKSSHSDLIENAEIMKTLLVSVLVKKETFFEFANLLKEKFGFTHPISAGGVDYPRENRMQMIYYLLNPESKITLTYRVNLARDNPELPSLTKVWEAMSFHEREAHEMFGFNFAGHNNLIPLLLPPNWHVLGKGYPLRKDWKMEDS